MTKDVLGKAIQDYHFSSISKPIHLKINGIEEEALSPSVFFRNRENMPALEQQALEMCRGKILDIGAAAGCHSLILQDLPHEVLALEPSAACIEVMNDRGIAQTFQGKVQDYHAQKFDTILLLMNGWGMSQKLDHLPDFLKLLSELLLPGGQILGDSSDIIYTYEQEDGSLLLPSDRYYGEVTFELEYQGLKDAFDWLYVDQDSLSDAASQAGMRITKCFDGPHYDYLAVMQKESE